MIDEYEEELRINLEGERNHTKADSHTRKSRKSRSKKKMTIDGGTSQNSQ